MHAYTDTDTDTLTDTQTHTHAHKHTDKHTYTYTYQCSSVTNSLNSYQLKVGYLLLAQWSTYMYSKMNTMASIY